MDSNREKPEKSLFLKQMEIEKMVKDHYEKQQVDELNKAMVQGQDLNQAAREIFGPPLDRNTDRSQNHGKLKSSAPKDGQNKTVEQVDNRQTQTTF